MLPKITIIVPVYNAQQTLPACFDCLVRQTLGQAALRYLFVDDCSTDNSPALLAQFCAAHDNATVLRTPKNTGVAGAARNLALGQVTTPYIMFLDADDTYPPDACEILCQAIETHCADLATGYRKTVDAEGNVLAERPAGYGDLPAQTNLLPQQLAQELIFRDSFWCKLYKTDLIREHDLSFPVGIPGEDIYFLYSYILCCHRCRYTARHVYNYTQSPTSVMHRANAEFYRGLSDCYHRMQHLFSRHQAAAGFRIVTQGILEYHMRGIAASEVIDTAQAQQLLSDWMWLFAYEADCGILEDSPLAHALFMTMKSGALPRAAIQLKSFPLWQEALELERQKRFELAQHAAALAAENAALRQSHSFRLGDRLLHPFRK